MVWSRIVAAGPAVLVLIVSTAALLLLPPLRRLTARGRRHRGGVARTLLGLAIGLATTSAAIGTMGAASPGNVLQLGSLLALLLGLVAVCGLVLFDVVLPRLRIEVPSIVRDLLLVSVSVAIAMGFLRLAGLDVFSLVTTSAVLTAVVGLALQTTIANVASGLGLQLDRTLRRGEWIEVGEHIGKILEIGWRATRVHTKTGDTIFVPNGELVSKDVRSFGRSGGAHRLTVRIGFHYRHPPRDVRQVVLDAVRDAPGVLVRPAPECGPAEFGDSAVVYELRYWIGDFARDTEIDEEVRARIWYAARDSGLEFPYPTRTLTFATAADRPALDRPALAG
jgi:small-conductance mechanosensitive channel